MNKKAHIILGLIISAIMIPLAVFGASAGYKEFTLKRSISSWNLTNGDIHRLDEEIASKQAQKIEKQAEEVEAFKFMVATKIEQGLSVSEESMNRYLGL